MLGATPGECATGMAPRSNLAGVHDRDGFPATLFGLPEPCRTGKLWKCHRSVKSFVAIGCNPKSKAYYWSVHVAGSWHRLPTAPSSEAPTRSDVQDLAEGLPEKLKKMVVHYGKYF